MLTYNFENIDEPVYQYIYKCLKNDIIKGNLKANEKLPSKRSFAKNNGISTITIQNAYDQLASEGYIYTISKKGYYVSEISGLGKIPSGSPVSLAVKKTEKKKTEYLELSGSGTNPDNFPFTVWARVMRNVISSKKEELMEPCNAGGCRQLREAITAHLYSFKGMQVDPEQIIVGAGTQYLYTLLIQLLGSDKKYCIENPGYRKLLDIYRANHVDCKLASLDSFGMSMESLNKSGADIAHISPAHHFPTGIVMPAARRYEMLAWANEKEGRYIIEDDYDSEFRVNGKPILPMFGMDACGKVIYMNTFSKTLSPTIRISYMILPAELANRFYESFSFYSCTVSNFEQYALSEFISLGYFEKHINRMRLYYSRKRRELLELIWKSRYAEKCHIIENCAGLHFILKIDTKLSDRELMDKLERKGIRIKALSEYYMDNSNKSKNMFLLDYSNLDIQRLSVI